MRRIFWIGIGWYLGFSAAALAQITVVPIAQVQRPGADGNSSALVGQTVTVTGRVSVPPGTFNAGSFYIQDATGGVQCYLPGVRLSLGDSVLVTGKVKEYNGETEIVPAVASDVRVLGSGEPPLPVFFPLAVSEREPYEGRLVRTWGKIGRIFGSTVYLSDGRGKIKCYIDSNTQISLQGFVQDDVIGVVGVLSEYQGEQEIKPRFQQDLWHSGAVAGDGNGTVHWRPAGVQVLSEDTLRFVLRADTTFTISKFSLTLPENWFWSGDGADLVWRGPGLTNADLSIVSQDSLAFYHAAVTSRDSAVVELLGVRAPAFNTTGVFTVRTAVAGGRLAPVFRQPAVRVEGGTSLMRAIHTVDSSGVPELLGATVVLEGTVTAAGLFPDFAFLQNSQGGVAIFDLEALGNVSRGDRVKVLGKLSFHQGLTGLDSVTVLEKTPSGQAVAPQTVAFANIAAQLNDGVEELESKLIRLTNVFVNTAWWRVTGTYSDFVLTDGYHQLTVRVYRNTSLAGLPAPKGPFNLSGILIQDDDEAPYTDHYVLLPRGAGDVQTSGGPTFVQGPELADVGANSFVLRWSTAGLAGGGLQYGKSTAYELGTLLDTTFSEEKTLEVTGLWPATVYHARAFAWSTDGGITYSPDLLLMTTSHPQSTGEVEVFFTRSVEQDVSLLVPAQGNVDVKARLIDRINRARYSIDLCLYSFNFYDYSLGKDPVVDALLQAKNRGVKIRFIYDSNHNQYSVKLLRQAGIPVIDNKFGNNLAEGIQHNKFIIFDARDTTSFADDWVWTGSFNVTALSQRENAENVVFIQDEALAKIYTMEFNEMWGGSGDEPNASTARFGPRKKDNTPHRIKIAGRWVESYFSPSDGTTAAISRALGTAEKNIAFCLLIFTRNDLYSRLVQIRSAHPGIGIHGVLEDENKNQSGSEWYSFQTGGWDVWPDALPGLLHHKYAVVDWGTDSDPLVITGSHNWTNSAETVNDENTLILHMPEVADQFWQEFAARYHEAGGSDPLTGVRERSAESPTPSQWQMAAFPNPVSLRAGQGVVTLEISAPAVFSRRQPRISIFNLLGQRIRSVRPRADQWKGKWSVPLNFRGLSAGIYFIQVQVGRKNLRQKLIVF